MTSEPDTPASGFDASGFDAAAFDTDDIVTRAADLVRTHYVFADVGEEIAGLLEHHLADGRYAAVHSVAELGTLVTDDLQIANGDKHLRLKFHQDPLPDLTDDAAEQAIYSVMARDDMAGIRRVERLAGNVGLICFADLLYPAEIVGSALAAAMSLIAGTTALVIDLRQNSGGDPGCVAMIMSYLVDEPTHLNSMVPRDPEGTTQHWTLPWVPGPRFGGRKPIWVLTSSRTFSGGEELAYDLQQLSRATIVGETTGGGANARDGFTVHPHLELTVPVVAARNPVSGKNWEGVGVTPDVSVAAADALEVAHRLALDSLAADVDSDLSPSLRREVAAALR